MSRDTLYRAYRDLGLSLDTARRDIRELLKPRIFGESATFFAVEDHGRIWRRSIYKIVEELQMTFVGLIEIKTSELTSYKAFRRALVDGVAYGINRDERNGTTNSRVNITKLTGVSRRTQRRYEQELGTVVQMNVFEPYFPAGTRDSEKTIRYKQRVVPWADGNVQNRNTFYSSREAVRFLTHHPNAEGINAADVDVYRSEYGERSMRQTFPDGSPTIDVLYDLVKTVDVDIRTGDAVRVSTGQPMGLFVRFIGGMAYTWRELTEALSLIEQYDRKVMLCQRVEFDREASRA